jgi:glycosyltransferase involved in cell wall biosynthesis
MKDSITAVIIGLNEGRNLEKAICSVRESGINSVIYVDSCSTDNSVAIAKCHGARVLIIENPLQSPGFARNKGVEHVSTTYVLLLDGDMTLDREFADNALLLFRDKSVACVTGPIRESFPRKNIYHRAISVHWLYAQTKEPATPAGGGLFKTEYFRQVNGYNPKIPAGEEIELRNKLLDNGFAIKSLGSYFANHDLNMNGLGDFVQRAIREGNLQAYALFDSENNFINRYKRLAIKNCSLMIAFLFWCIFSAFSRNLFLLIIPMILLILLVSLKNYYVITNHQDPIAMGLNIWFSYLKIPIQVYALTKYFIRKIITKSYR